MRRRLQLVVEHLPAAAVALYDRELRLCLCEGQLFADVDLSVDARPPAARLRRRRDARAHPARARGGAGRRDGRAGGARVRRPRAHAGGQLRALPPRRRPHRRRARALAGHLRSCAAPSGPGARPKSSCAAALTRRRSGWRWCPPTGSGCGSTARCARPSATAPRSCWGCPSRTSPIPTTSRRTSTLVGQDAGRRDPQLPAREALPAPRRPRGLGAPVGVAGARRGRSAAVLRLPDRGHLRAPARRAGTRSGPGRDRPLLRALARPHGHRRRRRLLRAHQPGLRVDPRLQQPRADEPPLHRLRPPRRRRRHAAGLPGPGRWQRGARVREPLPLCRRLATAGCCGAPPRSTTASSTPPPATSPSAARWRSACARAASRRCRPRS